MNEKLFYQASKLVSALKHSHIGTLAGCNWDRADRIARILQRAANRKARRWPAQWPNRFRADYGL